MGVFGPLKSAYREQVEQPYRGGANTVGKQHFTLLYDRARNLAFNIKSGWCKTGLSPFDPDLILNDIQKPPVAVIVPHISNANADLPLHHDMLRTPVTSKSSTNLRTELKQGSTLDSPNRYRFQKLVNAAEKAFVDRAILLDENK